MAVLVHAARSDKSNSLLFSMPLKINLASRFLLRIAGPDAQAFLQGQITQDVKQLKPGQALLFAHCSPKGRVLFNGYLWQEQEAWWMELPASRGPFAQDRLNRYRLRSRVTLEPVSTPYWGLIFSSAEECAESLHQARNLGLHAIGLDPTRHLLICPELPSPWNLMEEGTLEQWQQSTLERGIAEIEEDTADEWIPQMLNWDQLAGISFDKGCYTGQEIVARTHFLGKVKRGLVRIRAEAPLNRNQTLWQNQNDSAVGKVVAAVGHHGLAVLQEVALGTLELHLDSPEGPLALRAETP
jgi:folate-binding protein YgfZ